MLELIKTIKKDTTGIYKITSPSGKVYIGQAKCIRKRWHQYNLKECVQQTRLHASFKKYTVNKHIFEIIEICEQSTLSVRERYWQDFYDVLGRKGLNCVLEKTDTLPRKFSESYLKGLSKRMSGENHPNFGKKLSQETKDKIGNANRGNKYSEEILKAMSARAKIRGEKLKGIPRSTEVIEKIKYTKSLKTRYNSMQVLNLETGIYYDSVSEAARTYNINICTLNGRIARKSKKSNFIIV